MKRKLNYLIILAIVVCILAISVYSESVVSEERFYRNANPLSSSLVLVIEDPAVASLSTEDLIAEILDSDIVVSILACNTGVADGYERAMQYSSLLQELSKRDDAASALVAYFINNRDEMPYMEYICLGLLLTNENFSEKMTDSDIQALCALIE